MSLKHSDILAADSTIIVGLLIILTFQTLIDTTEIPYYDELVQNDFKFQKIETLRQECIMIISELEENGENVVNWGGMLSISRENFEIMCEQNDLDWFKERAFGNALHEWGIIMGYLDEDDATYEGNILNYYARGNVVKIIGIIMIMPFAISAISETIIGYIKEKDTENASRLGSMLLIVGFIILIPGLFVTIMVS